MAINAAVYASFGAMTVDHSDRSSESFSVTVITSLTPSIAARRAVVALRNSFDASFAIAVIDNDETDRHVGGERLPGRLRVHQRTLELRDLCRP
jgi:hypothetical protein